MRPEHRVLVELIDQMKPEGISTLEAALNALEHHAATIRGLMDENRRLREGLATIQGVAATLQQKVEP